MSKTASNKEISQFLERFRRHYVSVELVRVGGDQDGGYLIPRLLDSISHCFSPGVDVTATFERELSASYGIKSYMADASVSVSPVEGDDFSFVKKFIGTRTEGEYLTLEDWMVSSLSGDERDLILQMDIEGGEYDVLITVSEDALKKFSVIVLEFHSLEKIFIGHVLKMISSIFDKLYKDFSICHVHPNNCCGVVDRKGVSVPRTIEVTFIRNDCIDAVSRNEAVSLPHDLDRKNVPQNHEIVMPEQWWKK